MTRKKSLFVDLLVVVVCRGGLNANFVLTNMRMNAVGFAKEITGRI